jgi:hypothetical protein
MNEVGWGRLFIGEILFRDLSREKFVEAALPKAVPQLIPGLLPHLVHCTYMAPCARVRSHQAIVEEHLTDNGLHHVQKAHFVRRNKKPKSPFWTLNNFKDTGPGELLCNLTEELIRYIYLTCNLLAACHHPLFQ